MLKTRVITALFLIPSFFAALFLLPSLAWASLLLGISLIALYEWAQMIKLGKLATSVYLSATLLMGIMILWFTNQLGSHWLVYRSLDLFIMASVFWMLAVPFLLHKNKRIKFQSINVLVGWLLVMPLWLALVCLKIADPWLLLGLTATIWIADSAAYFAGKQFGKHKLAPTISPGKTWEGVLGGLLLVTLYGYTLATYFALPILVTLIVLWVMAILSVIGDLFESMIKRQSNLKDSGNILPGHGGILDRIDGMTSSLPIAVLMIFIYSLLHAA